jgi:hypothetical protein
MYLFDQNSKTQIYKMPKTFPPSDDFPSTDDCGICHGTTQIVVRDTKNMDLKIGKLTDCPNCSYNFEECEENCNGCYSCDGPGCETCGDNKFVDRIYTGNKYTGMVETPCPDCVCTTCCGIGHIGNNKTKCWHCHNFTSSKYFPNDWNCNDAKTTYNCNMCRDFKFIHVSNNDNKTANLKICPCSKYLNRCENCHGSMQEFVKFEGVAVTVSCKDCICQTCLRETQICNWDRNIRHQCPSCTR